MILRKKMRTIFLIDFKGFGAAEQSPQKRDGLPCPKRREKAQVRAFSRRHFLSIFRKITLFLHQFSGILGNHQLLIGGNYPHLDLGIVGGDQRFLAPHLVALRIQLYAHEA